MAPEIHAVVTPTPTRTVTRTVNPNPDRRNAVLSHVAGAHAGALAFRENDLDLWLPAASTEALEEAEAAGKAGKARGKAAASTSGALTPTQTADSTRPWSPLVPIVAALGSCDGIGGVIGTVTSMLLGTATLTLGLVAGAKVGYTALTSA